MKIYPILLVSIVTGMGNLCSAQAQCIDLLNSKSAGQSVAASPPKESAGIFGKLYARFKGVKPNDHVRLLLISNTELWHTVGFEESRHSPDENPARVQKARDYGFTQFKNRMPSPNFEGQDGDVFMINLVWTEDFARWGERPRMIKLITTGLTPEQVERLKGLFLSKVGKELKSYSEAKVLDDTWKSGALGKINEYSRWLMDHQSEWLP